MSDEYVLDAHALLWFLLGSPRLGAAARAAMLDSASVLYLPIIGLAEACWAVERGKCAIPSVAALLADMDADSRILLVPLDRAILELSLTLNSIREMHARQIVATALQLFGSGSSLALLTCDQNITASGLVPVVW
jgi:PIN domain nuclease of toxin-antitoxin system